MFVTILPLLYLCSTGTCPLYPAVMCGVDLATMKQLLNDQRRALIHDMREHIVSEVATQLAPHVARLDQLQDDQTQLKKQLSDIFSQLKQGDSLRTSACNNIQPSSSSCPTPAPSDPPIKEILSNSTLVQAETEIASRTLSFYPIPCDLTAIKTSPTEPVPTKTIIEKAFLNFLQNSMVIPPKTLSEITWLDISHRPENCEITVLFTNQQTVKTIFRHVKNLPPGERVSINVPPALASRYKYLRSKAFLLRNGETRQKTVIKYHGASLALYARPCMSAAWTLVEVATPALEPVQPVNGAKNVAALTMS